MTVLLVWGLSLQRKVDLGPSAFVEWLMQLGVFVVHFGNWEAFGRNFFIASRAVFSSLKGQVFVLLLRFRPQMGCHHWKLVWDECLVFFFLLKNLAGSLARQAHLTLLKSVTWSHWFLHLLVVWLNQGCSLFPACFNNVPNSYRLITLGLKLAKNIFHFFFRTARSWILQLPLLNGYLLGRTMR